MNKIKLIAFDLDGTLLYPTSSSSFIEEEYINLLRIYYDSSIKLCVVTGRGPSFVKRISDVLKRECISICYNGAYIPSFNYCSPIEKEYIDEIEKRVDKIMYFTKDSSIYVREKNFDYYYEDYKKRLNKNINLTQEYIYDDKRLDELIKDNQVIKLLINESFNTDNLSDLSFYFKSSSKNIEVIKKGFNKGKSLEFIVNKLNICKDEVCVLGDEENDIPMFKIFPNSFIIDHDYNKHIDTSKYRINNVLEIKKYIDC